jgi:hypothetical protein
MKGKQIEQIELEFERLKAIDLEAKKTKYLCKVKPRKKNTHLTPKKKKRK